MKAPPLLFGGKSPVVAYLRHSMIVLSICQPFDSTEEVPTHRLARAIIPYYESQRCGELDRFASGVVE